MDCVEGMKLLDDNSIDSIVTDPPYNLSKSKKLKMSNKDKLDGFGGDWNITNEKWDKMTFEDYLSFTRQWLSECKRVLKPTGSIWVFGSYHNIGVINVCFQLLHIEILNEIIWFKRNAFPNLTGKRFTASHENIIWGHTGDKKREYYFDYELSKSMECPEDNLKKDGKQMRTVWDIPNNKTKEELKYKHPTQKPEKLIKRIIQLTTKENDIVLDCFMGSGTTAKVAKELNRQYIGFELDEKYYKSSLERIENHKIA